MTALAHDLNLDKLPEPKFTAEPQQGHDFSPFRIQVPDAALEDLKARLARTRWPVEAPGAGWSRGVPTDYLKRLTEYWQTSYDFRRHEAELNQYPQATTVIDGQTIHFIHVRARVTNAKPLLLIHGWPGSVVEFMDVIAPLSDPLAHGAAAEGAFELVIPSIPGHGFSMPLNREGWTSQRIAAAFNQLMRRLGYLRYGVQGGDAGAFIAPWMGRLDPSHVAGVHVNALVQLPSVPRMILGSVVATKAERVRLQRFKHYYEEMMGYAQIQGTRPKTLSFGLNDSPVGQLAWIVEKFKEWVDPAAELPEDAVDRDRILTNASLYWFTGSAGSAANLYYETVHDPSFKKSPPRNVVPTGVLVSTQDVTIRRWAERENNVVHWTELDHGGHFAALEAPRAFVKDVREFFRSIPFAIS
jgi:pimeloyl-ACP methyl ester carboxylesterase